MSVNITHIKITGITRSNTLMHLKDRIKTAIKVSSKVQIEGQIIEEYRGALRLVGHYKEGDVVSTSLMFLLGCLSQRIFNHRPVEDGSDYNQSKEVTYE